MSPEQIRDWLFSNYLRRTDETERQVECILAQDGWKHLDAQTERYAGMAEDDTQAGQAHGFALSALYECHGGPHLPTCPSAQSKTLDGA